MREQREVDERRRASAGPPSFRAAVAHHIKAEFAVGGFVRPVHFVHRRFEAAIPHEQFEVLNQPFDAAVRRRFVRDHHFAIGANIHGAARQVLNGCGDDVHRFEHLAHADEVAGQAIAAVAADDFERRLQFGVSQIRFVFSQIAGDTGCAGDGAGATAVDRFFAGQGTDALGSVDEDFVLVQQPADVAVGFRERLHKRPHLAHE